VSVVSPDACGGAHAGAARADAAEADCDVGSDADPPAALCGRRSLEHDASETRSATLKRNRLVRKAADRTGA